MRNARIVLIDADGVRAPVVASWLAQMGWDVSVLDGGVACGLAGTASATPALSALLAAVGAQALNTMLTAISTKSRVYAKRFFISRFLYIDERVERVLM